MVSYLNPATLSSSLLSASCHHVNSYFFSRDYFPDILVTATNNSNSNTASAAHRHSWFHFHFLFESRHHAIGGVLTRHNGCDWVSGLAHVRHQVKASAHINAT
eukprot:scpid101935/ scgid12600/ 